MVIPPECGCVAVTGGVAVGGGVPVGARMTCKIAVPRLAGAGSGRDQNSSPIVAINSKKAIARAPAITQKLSNPRSWFRISIMIRFYPKFHHLNSVGRYLV